MVLLNKAANVVKVGGIWLADLLNFLCDPFEEFTRPEETKYFEFLWEKAIKFEADFLGFWWGARNVYLYTIPGNSGDQCLWHGIYTAMWAIKYSMDKEAVDLQRLKMCADGLLAHQTPEDGRRLIRGWRTDGTYEDEVSNDQATGHLLGIYFLWKYGDSECRTRARDLIMGLADELVFHGNKLVNADGSVTRHGNLENGLSTDPLNLTLCLAVYKVAYKITDEEVYNERYSSLCEKYRLLVPYANVRLLWWEKTHHAHRAAIHYSILCDLEMDHNIHRKYLRGLLRTWRMERKSANPWIYYLVRRICLVDPAYEERVKKHLKEFTCEDKKWNVEKINSDKVPSFQWGQHLRARQPLPRWKVGSQDFFWQRHLYSVDDWKGNITGDVQHNGGDYLIAYWGLRSLGIIGSTE